MVDLLVTTHLICMTFHYITLLVVGLLEFDYLNRAMSSQ